MSDKATNNKSAAKLRKAAVKDAATDKILFSSRITQLFTGVKEKGNFGDCSLSHQVLFISVFVGPFMPV